MADRTDIDRLTQRSLNEPSQLLSAISLIIAQLWAFRQAKVSDRIDSVDTKLRTRASKREKKKAMPIQDLSICV